MGLPGPVAGHVAHHREGVDTKLAQFRDRGIELRLVSRPDTYPSASFADAPREREADAAVAASHDGGQTGQIQGASVLPQTLFQCS
jgi:hypothetical protein